MSICVSCGEVIPEGRMVCRNCEDVTQSFNTLKIWVSLDKITDIKNFVELVSHCKDDVVVKSGNFAINAKSLMGLYSIDLTKPVEVEFYGSIPYEVEQGVKEFIVDLN